jgi:hypothetical protein
MRFALALCLLPAAALLACLPPAAAQPIDPAIRILGNWQPAAADNQAVVAVTQRYFTLVDGGHYQEAYALLDGSLTQMLPYADYVASARHVLADGGAARLRAITSIDWEKGTPPGPYAALHYTGRAASGQLCGELAWRRDANGAYLLVREQIHIIPVDTPPKATIAMKAQFGCLN